MQTHIRIHEHYIRTSQNDAEIPHQSKSPINVTAVSSEIFISNPLLKISVSVSVLVDLL